jgi:cytochrome b pre-mRNA-processing protein 3
LHWLQRHGVADLGRDHPFNRLQPQANPMIFRWFVPTSRERSIASLYGAIVAQARRPAFYQIYRVPDTVNGRLEMIMLHAVLILRRLQYETTGGRDLGQGLFDHFCRDMDDNMREMGVGDLTVPRKMRLIGQAFYSRQSAYGDALASPHDEQLAAVLARNVFAEASERNGAARLATYSRQTFQCLATQDGFERGEASFPDPERVLVHA